MFITKGCELTVSWWELNILQQAVRTKIGRYIHACIGSYWSALFAVQLVNILKLSIKMMDGFVMDKRWTNSFKIFIVVVSNSVDLLL
jgi:hypothetical protein